MDGFTGKYLGFDFFIDLNFLLLLFFASILGSLLRLCLIYILNQRFLNNTNNAILYALLPPTGYLITSIISSNIALSLGMVGALSIIRFRTPVKNPAELVYYFMLITLGIVLNVNQNFAVNFTIYVLGISFILFFGVKLLQSFDLFKTYNFDNDYYFLNVEIDDKKEYKKYQDNEYLQHLSYDNQKTLMIFKSSNKKYLYDLIDEFKQDNLISYSLDLSSDEN